MLKVSQLMRMDVYVPRRGSKGDPKDLAMHDLSLVGKIRQVVFSPQGDIVVGFLIRRPDVAGMIKRDDAFLARDSFAVCDSGLVATRGQDSLDERAIERLGLDWDACILWTGMDARTSDGKDLGWVGDVRFSPKNGHVDAFLVGDGSVAESLVGDVEIPVSMLRGYHDGYMIVDDEAAHLALSGGLAARAGEGYARAKQSGKVVLDRAGKAAGSAVEKGAYGLGRMIGKAKASMAEPDDVPRVDAEESDADKLPKEKDGENNSGSPKSDKGKTTKKGAAHAVGKRLGRTKGMFGAFVEEYKKASR